ncbi:hypothetical protein AMECASPLE_021239 [Ameca splendens]|uniref:Uncharacterized protein n=1 Tax=Ameca splendens TaxID=208324 RepID=A0ABV0Z1I0_9TELE
MNNLFLLRLDTCICISFPASEIAWEDHQSNPSQMHTGRSNRLMRLRGMRFFEDELSSLVSLFDICFSTTPCKEIYLDLPTGNERNPFLDQPVTLEHGSAVYVGCIYQSPRDKAKLFLTHIEHVM